MLLGNFQLPIYQKEPRNLQECEKCRISTSTMGLQTAAGVETKAVFFIVFTVKNSSGRNQFPCCAEQVDSGTPDNCSLGLLNMCACALQELITRFTNSEPCQAFEFLRRVIQIEAPFLGPLFHILHFATLPATEWFYCQNIFFP